MNILLVFFALPIAVIIISIALQRILRNPALVAAIIFAVFLIVTFVVNNLNFLIATIVYAILSFVTALITCILCRFFNRIGRDCLCNCGRRERGSCNNNNNMDNNVLTISSVENNTSNCGCNQNDNERSYQITSSDGTTTRVNIISNSNNNGCRRR